MDRSLYLASVTLHLLAAMVWLGGMFFVALVGAPVLRHVDPPQLRAQVFRRLGEQFRLVGWICIGVLLVTGVLNLHMRGVLARLGSGAFWATPFGTALAWKLGLVALMVALSAVHDFVHGPAASRLVPGSPEALRARRQAALMARLNAVAGIVLVIVAVRLARGG